MINAKIKSKEESGAFISRDSVHRLLRDVKQIMVNPLIDNGIYYHHSDEDMLKGYAMIIGPRGTPYFGGYYFFDIGYPPDYPHSPPVVKYCTNGDNVRFNPNLYKSGKVCISVLNTWRGDQWNSCQTITSMLLTLCTLLCENPLLNEPGINTTHKDFANYNRIIEYKNIEIATLHLLNKKDDCYLPWFDMFFVAMVKHFAENNGDLFNHLQKVIESARPHKTKTYKTSLYNMTIYADYTMVETYFKKTQKHVQMLMREECDIYKDIVFKKKIVSVNKAVDGLKETGI